MFNLYFVDQVEKKEEVLLSKHFSLHNAKQRRKQLIFDKDIAPALLIIKDQSGKKITLKGIHYDYGKSDNQQHVT